MSYKVGDIVQFMDEGQLSSKKWELKFGLVTEIADFSHYIRGAKLIKFVSNVNPGTTGNFADTSKDKGTVISND